MTLARDLVKEPRLAGGRRHTEDCPRNRGARSHRGTR